MFYLRAYLTGKERKRQVKSPSPKSGKGLDVFRLLLIYSDCSFDLFLLLELAHVQVVIEALLLQ